MALDIQERNGYSVVSIKLEDKIVSIKFDNVFDKSSMFYFEGRGYDSGAFIDKGGEIAKYDALWKLLDDATDEDQTAVFRELKLAGVRPVSNM